MGVTVRTSELEGIFEEGLTNGIPLRQMCRDQGVSKSAVYDWMDADPDFAGRIARARGRGYHEIADTCIEIADDKAEDPASRRVRIEARLKLLAKWDPKGYGEKLEVNQKSEVIHRHDLDSLSAADLDALERLVEKATHASGDTGGAGPTRPDSVH